jgi:hypothetical protein
MIPLTIANRSRTAVCRDCLDIVERLPSFTAANPACPN